MSCKIIKYELIIKGIVFTSLIFSFSLTMSCRTQTEPIVEDQTVSNEVKEYFVDYKIGTKFIFQDTLQPAIFDTIELISKENYNVNNGSGELSLGFKLLYSTVVSKSFEIIVSPGADNISYIRIDPMVSASGAVTFENHNGQWTTNSTYYESIILDQSLFNDVVLSSQHSLFHNSVMIGRGQGIVYLGSNYNGNSNRFKQIKIIEP